MYKKLKIASALAGFLISIPPAQADPAPVPPTVIVNGNLLTGGGGNYSTGDYNGEGGPGSLTIDGTGAVSFSSSGFYYTPTYIITPAYMVPGYTIYGYYIPPHSTPGYWSDGSPDGGYEDAEGNWVQTGTWIEPVEYPEVMVTDIVVPDEYFPDEIGGGELVQTSANASGTYVHFAFQMDSGMSVQPADAIGNPWVTAPQFGIPAVKVNSQLWQFSAADNTAAYDYFTNAAGDGWLWITPGFYGGYDPVLNVAFAGTNRNGFFLDTSATGVQLLPRNSNGSFLALGAPTYGPPQIWSNGLTFRFLTKDTTNAVDVYLAKGDGYLLVDSQGGVSGMVVDAYADGVFQATPTFAATATGSPLPAESQPAWGPPAMYVGAELWRYRGSTSTADYYGGPRAGQVLSIGSDGVVTYSDRILNISNVTGFYAGGAFQDLPVVMRSVAADNTPWSTLPPNSGYPPAVTVDNQPWYFSSTLSGPGYVTYLDPLSGKTLYVSGSYAVISDPATGTYLTGRFADGQFTFATVAVGPANPDGTPMTRIDPNSPQLIAGDLDIAGALTLGSWLDAGGESVYGFALSFTSGDHGSLLRFDATRFVTDWLWTRVLAPGATEPLDAMRLDSSNRLTLYTPHQEPAPAIILAPGGRSRFDGPVRIAPQGDLSMGPFTSEPSAP